ncbi:MAG: extracellular solute-binding protein [Scytolyngbya sp. HA4215-MV1]|nr:extracellular solute-binding protein [Scytolyngbya sp. HA4215-MV1]
MNRRSFLYRLGALTLSQGLLGCGSSRDRLTLRIELLKGSIPALMLGRFREKLQRNSVHNFALDFNPQPRLQDLFELLQGWKRRANVPKTPNKPLIPIPFIAQPPAGASDLVTLGDYWLETAIQQKLIQPLDLSQWQQWQTLPPRWQTLVTRDLQGNPDPKGQVWAAPYRWGCTMLVYRKDLFEQQGLSLPTDWHDLWRKELCGKFSLLDHPREIIGLALKKLGCSYNLPNLQPVPNLKSELIALNRQTKFYSSTDYLQPLLLGQTLLAVGWSTDILSAMKRNYKLQAIIPQSGTALWADLWVRPASAPPPNQAKLLNQWIDFCWQPEIAEQLSLQSHAVSPVFIDRSTSKLPEPLRKNPLLVCNEETLRNSEFLLPIAKPTLEQHRLLWQSIRQVVPTSPSL